MIRPFRLISTGAGPSTRTHAYRLALKSRYHADADTSLAIAHLPRVRPTGAAHRQGLRRAQGVQRREGLLLQPGASRRHRRGTHRGEWGRGPPMQRFAITRSSCFLNELRHRSFRSICSLIPSHPGSLDVLPPTGPHGSMAGSLLRRLAYQTILSTLSPPSLYSCCSPVPPSPLFVSARPADPPDISRIQQTPLPPRPHLQTRGVSRPRLPPARTDQFPQRRLGEYHRRGHPREPGA